MKHVYFFHPGHLKHLHPLATIFVAVVIFAAIGSADSAETFLKMKSDHGDYIGQGLRYDYNTADGTFSAWRNYYNGVTVSFHSPSWDHWWYLNFGAPDNGILTVGTYPGAMQLGLRDPGSPGLDVFGNGGGCGTLTGSFEVREIVYGTGDEVIAFAAVFEQHCEGAVPALRGEVRFNSSIIDPPVVPKTIRVPSKTYPTIQGAINAAVDGDTVLVAPGTYFENIDFLGKFISVTSEGGPEATVIDGGHANSVVKCISGESPASVLDGFTLRNGSFSNTPTSFCNGGGIAISYSSPTIMNNIITANETCQSAGICIYVGAPIIQNNRITKNRPGCTGGSGGGGILVLYMERMAYTQILDNVISHNVMASGLGGGGISLFGSGPVSIRGNIITDNSSILGGGGGIYIVNDSDALIAGNVIVRNKADEGGGIFWLVGEGNRGPLLINNTIADNDAQEGSGIFADGYDAATEIINNIIVAKPGQTAVYCGDFNDLNPPVISFNDVYSPTGLSYGGICTDQTGINGNISSNPLFVNPSGDNYHLKFGSPAIDAGDTTALALPVVDIDQEQRIADGNGDGIALVDMGADEYIGYFSISGNVSTRQGIAISGVLMTLRCGNSSRTATTNTSGNYSFSNLASDSYTVTPSLAGYTFSPAKAYLSVNNANASNINFSATTMATYSISGTITSGGNPLANVAVALTGAAIANTTTNAQGQYTFSNLANGGYTVTPTVAGYTFNPVSANVTINNTNVSGINFVGTPGVATYSISGTITTTGKLAMPVEAVTVTLTGGPGGSTTTNASGIYAFSGLINGGYSVTPSQAGYTFAPVFRTVTISGVNVTGQNFVRN